LEIYKTIANIDGFLLKVCKENAIRQVRRKKDLGIAADTKNGGRALL
jgi:hypothetical protein